ncbi:MAG TPA: hypothetical protein VGE73_06485 [Pseudolabrys sp.]
MSRTLGVMFAAMVALGGASLIAPAAAQTVVSSVTRFDIDKCRYTAGKAEEDYGEWRCSGFQGIPIYATSGDMRFYVSFGRNAKNEPAARETLASFNGEGTTIEWRSERGANGKLTPFAAIMRFRTSVADGDKTVPGQVLVVTRLGDGRAPGTVCRVGYVDARANPDANVLAQKIADEHARSFKCGSDKPVMPGQRGPGLSGPMGD